MSIEYNLPGICKVSLKFNIQLDNLIKSNPEYFYDDIKVGSVYGMFPGIIFSSGRLPIAYMKKPSKELLDGLIERLNDTTLPKKLVMTNSQLAESDLSDTDSNYILERFHNDDNTVILNSDVLYSYIKKNYPKYKTMLSTTACLRTADSINEALDKYDYVVTDFRDNYNYDLLKSIKDPSRIELLINEFCSKNCLNRKLCYQSISKKTLDPSYVEFHKCLNTYGPESTIKDLLDKSKYNIIHIEDLYKMYPDMGFKIYKLSGRGAMYKSYISHILYYMVKPEYSDIVQKEIMKGISLRETVI